MAPPKVSASQIRAFRLAQQGLSERHRDPLKPFADAWAIQDSPPGAAHTATIARTIDVAPDWLDTALTQERSIVALYNARTATSYLPAADVAAFGTALLPEDDAAYKAILGRSAPGYGDDLAEPAGLAVDAISAALDRQALSRDALHEELRHRLPEQLLPWCEGCQSHHARRGLLVVASLRGRLCISGREGRQPIFSRTDQWVGWDAPPIDEARAALARRYLRWYGPTTPAALADWAGLSKGHANELWATIEDDLAEVTVDGHAAWILADDNTKLTDPPEATGVRLVGPGDPLLQAKDREVLIDDPAIRKQMWTSIPTTGVVLADGQAVATWKAKKAGKRLALTVSTFGRLTKAHRASVCDEAERLAPHRGCTGTQVSVD